MMNVALLLFSKELLFLQSEIECIRFSGSEPIKLYIDFKSMEGSVFSLVEDGIKFVIKNIKKAIWMVLLWNYKPQKGEYL